MDASPNIPKMILGYNMPLNFTEQVWVMWMFLEKQVLNVQPLSDIERNLMSKDDIKWYKYIIKDGYIRGSKKRLATILNRLWSKIELFRYWML